RPKPVSCVKNRAETVQLFCPSGNGVKTWRSTAPAHLRRRSFAPSGGGIERLHSLHVGGIHQTARVHLRARRGGRVTDRRPRTAIAGIDRLSQSAIAR